MKKSVVFLICLAFAVVIVGIGFGTSKLIGSVTSSLSSNSPSDNDGEGDVPVSKTQTWFAANLPGAEQLIFRDFESSDELEKGGVFVFNGTTFETYDGMFDGWTVENGYLEHRNYSEVPSDPLIFFPSYDTKDMTVIPELSADVVVIDFEFWHPCGTPNTFFCINHFGVEADFLFTNFYATDYGESGPSDGVYNYCINVCEKYAGGGEGYTHAIYDLGEDFTRKLHITILVYEDVALYYVNGIFLVEHIVSDINFEKFALLEISGDAFNYEPIGYPPIALEYGSFCMDNLEMVKFGDGSGSYSGALMQFKTDHSLAIGDIINGG